MRIGLMVSSDEERPRADRLSGLLDEGNTAEIARGPARIRRPHIDGGRLPHIALQPRDASSLGWRSPIVTRMRLACGGELIRHS
jgi:hypothetical protein